MIKLQVTFNLDQLICGLIAVGETRPKRTNTNNQTVDNVHYTNTVYTVCQKFQK